MELEAPNMLRSTKSYSNLSNCKTAKKGTFGKRLNSLKSSLSSMSLRDSFKVQCNEVSSISEEALLEDFSFESEHSHSFSKKSLFAYNLTEQLNHVIYNFSKRRNSNISFSKANFCQSKKVVPLSTKSSSSSLRSDSASSETSDESWCSEKLIIEMPLPKHYIYSEYQKGFRGRQHDTEDDFSKVIEKGFGQPSAIDTAYFPTLFFTLTPTNARLE